MEEGLSTEPGTVGTNEGILASHKIRRKGQNAHCEENVGEFMKVIILQMRTSTVIFTTQKKK